MVVPAVPWDDPVQAAVQPPPVANEVVRTHAPGSRERESLRARLRSLAAEKTELPMVIGGRDVMSSATSPIRKPHDHACELGRAHLGGREEVRKAIGAAARAHPEWSRAPWTERAAVFLRAAELLAGPWRDTLNAATMLGQSKTVHQAEIDSAAELIDFLRFNVHFMRRLHREQPISPPGTWNQLDYRPLEGFVFAVTPFNFTAIAGNLPTAPALLGNTVVWKPALSAALSAHFIMRLLQAAGLPDGVINLVHGDGADVAAVALADASFAGVHFTGSTAVFNSMQRTIGAQIDAYRSYPRVVGETGGKNFIVAHPSAAPDALATAIIRGGFEYQGQKCSAASRVFVPRSLWPGLRERLCDEIASIKVGDVEDFTNFMGAVIDEKAFRRLETAIESARRAGGTEILCGGTCDSSVGYFVQPTLIETSVLGSPLLHEELFGPIVTAFVYDDAAYEEVLRTIDERSRYGLTGAVFARDRVAISAALSVLRNAAGNFYVNDKPTGAVVGQQPFGGARASGTNDKAGSLWNLTRWVSPRAIKETFVPPADYRYPFMAPEGDTR
ncbi:MAG TPA: L-glutamate gamma-semialdehyde dehydrogenase [Steroidobacteraceae bacterium]|nr:L-glutamate gamma-semialdehyde dehydrogenase [Steroidobacteraceae bacterium]